MKDHKQVATRPVMLLVLGPHRSGTSLTARLLECLGAKNSRNCLPPEPDNPTGFFEDADIYRFSQTILMPRLHRHWSHITPVDWSRLSKADRSRLGLQALEILRRNYPPGRPLSVLKQPRINDTLPFWLSLLEHAGFEVRVVCVVRDPVSVARSLAERNGFPVAHTGMLYLSNWLSVLPHLQEHSVAFLQFDEIFASPAKALRSVAQKLSLSLPADFDERIHEFTAQHLNQSLRHNSLPQDDVALEPDLPPLVVELYRTLVQAAQAQNVHKTAKFAAQAGGLLRDISPLLESFDALLGSDPSRKTLPKSDTATPTRDAAPTTLPDSPAARLGELEKAHEELSGRHAALMAERENIQIAHSDLAARHASITAGFEELKTRHTSLIAEREAHTASHDDLATRHNSLVAAFKELDDKHATLSTTHSALVAERDDLGTSFSSLKSDHSALLAERNALATSAQELATSHTSLATVLEELQSQHSSLIAERDALVQERELIRSERDSLAQERNQLSAEHDALVTESEVLRSESSSFSTVHSSLIAERDDLGTRLASLKADHSTLLLERDALASSAEDLATALDELQDQHAFLVAERDKLLASSNDTVAENKLLLQQITHVQEDLEKCLLRNKELQQQANLLADSEKRRQSLERAQQELEKAQKQSAARAEALEKEQGEIAGRLGQIEEEKGFLLAQLQQVQEEIEHYFHENRRLRRRVLAGGEAESLLQAESLTLGSIETTPPHLHINYSLEQARFAARDLGRVRLRLVEHHGRPGLAVFRRDGEEPPLGLWRVTGEEEGDTFQLVVPQDIPGEDYIAHAPADDLVFLREAARMLAAHLAERDEPGRHATWRRTTQLFVDHLHDKIRRLTFGAVTCTESAETNRFDFNITPALLGHHTWTSLAGSWKPGTLVLRLATDGTPPLSSWPRDATGQLIEEVEFRPGVKPEASERREFWRSFTARDRLLLDALADSLPRLAAEIPGGSKNTAAWRPAMMKFPALLRSEWTAAARKQWRLFRP
jgi:hypothetical protein